MAFAIMTTAILNVYLNNQFLIECVITILFLNLETDVSNYTVPILIQLIWLKLYL
jgi:hypothetical protein